MEAPGKRPARHHRRRPTEGASRRRAGSSLGPNAFVGDWDCEGETVAITTSAIVTGAQTEQIAWIETGKNADFGLFTTKGARYSVFDQERNSLTLVAHADNSSRACRLSG